MQIDSANLILRQACNVRLLDPFSFAMNAHLLRMVHSTIMPDHLRYGVSQSLPLLGL